MTIEIVLATGNQGKVEEFQHAAKSNAAVRFLPQSDFGIGDVPETGVSFVENALIKARFAADRCQYPVLADDSGLMVHALNDEPGLYSSRYAGEKKSDKANIEKLLSELKATKDKVRAATFHCSLVFMAHAEDPAPLIFQGFWHGQIVEEPRGDLGFGYDPIFFVPEFDCTVGELDPLVKERHSHRGIALKHLFNAWSVIESRVADD